MREPKDVTILVVDDEPALRKALVFDFKRKGFQVLDASNGKEAFEIVKTQKIDLILTDVRMPGGDGIELLDKVKEQNPMIPVVMFITGFADLSLDEAYNKGADAVFTKPFDRKSLMAAVMRVTIEKSQLWGVRNSDRLAVEFTITLQFSELGTAVQGKVLNIGRGGMFVALKAPFPKVENKVTFHIQFEQGSPQEISGSGIVRWIRTQLLTDHPTGCGIEFEYLSDQSRDHIIELINQMKTKAFIPNK